MKKNKVKNIEEALKNVEERKQNAEDVKLEAEQVIEEAKQTITEAKQEIKELDQATGKLQKAKKKQEEANKECDEALAAAGYKKKEEKKKGNGIVKGIVIGATTVALIVGGYHLIKHSKNGNIKWFSDSKKPNSTTGTTNPTDTNNSNGIIYDYENNEAIISKEPMNKEKLEELVTKFTKYLSDKKINVDTEDVLKFAVITNLDIMKEDCPELVKEIIGTQSKEEFLGDAFNVIGAAMNYNFKVYDKEGKTDNFVRFSEVVYDEAGKKHLLLIEEYVDKIAVAKENPSEQDRLVEEFINILYNSTKELENIEEGIGLASMLAINDMANHVTFVDATCQISDENRGTLINHTNAELYIPGIFANLEECQNEDLTMSYTRGLKF